MFLGIHGELTGNKVKNRNRWTHKVHKAHKA